MPELLKPTFTFSMWPKTALFIGVIWERQDTEDEALGLSDTVRNQVRFARQTITIGVIPFFPFVFAWTVIICGGKRVI